MEFRADNWRWWEVLLWSYSTLLLLFLLVIMVYDFFIPITQATQEYRIVSVVNIILIQPIIIFMLHQGIIHINKKA